mgnify:CR=1 FL=1
MSISPELYREKYDLTGRTFGRLKVLEKVPPPDHVKDKRTSYWKCQCRCGNEIIARRNGLTSGRTQSCGCLKRDLNCQTKKKNEVIEHEGYLEGIDASGNNFFVSTVDRYIFDMAYWRVHPNGYVRAGNNGGASLHRLIMQAKDGEIVDHRNHNPSDNRRENLRVTNTQNNTRNKTIPRNNRSGVIGVCQERRGVWRAYITLNDYNLKLYNGRSRDEAIRRRLLAERDYFGEFAPQQHLFQQYGIEVENNQQTASLSDGTQLHTQPNNSELCRDSNPASA